MRKAEILMHDRAAGILSEIEKGRHYRFEYYDAYDGPALSLAMPVRPIGYEYDQFPPFFEGLLPEGYNLEALLRIYKIDRHDLLSQLIAVGGDMVGAVTAKVLE